MSGRWDDKTFREGELKEMMQKYLEVIQNFSEAQLNRQYDPKDIINISLTLTTFELCAVVQTLAAIRLGPPAIDVLNPKEEKKPE